MSALDDIDAEDMALHVRRQIRIVGRTLVFALPKGKKKRRVPLSAGVLAAMRAHDEAYSSTEITLPWDEPGGKSVTSRLLVTGDAGRLYSGDLFHKVIWQAAFRAAGLEYRNRADGMNALRHFLRLGAAVTGRIDQGAGRVPGSRGPRLHASDVHAPGAVQLRACPDRD
jgi:integrase